MNKEQVQAFFSLGNVVAELYQANKPDSFFEESPAEICEQSFKEGFKKALQIIEAVEEVIDSSEVENG